MENLIHILAHLHQVANWSKSYDDLSNSYYD